VPGKIAGFYGDGAYDKWKVYETLAKRRIKAIVPPQRNAKIKQHGNSSGRPLSRDVAIRAIRRRGCRRWKERRRLSSPQSFGNSHVSDEMLFWRPFEKTAKSKTSERKPVSAAKSSTSSLTSDFPCSSGISQQGRVKLTLDVSFHQGAGTYPSSR